MPRARRSLTPTEPKPGLQASIYRDEADESATQMARNRPFCLSFAGNGLAHLMNVAKKPSPAAIAFKPKRGRKSLIEWNDPSRQAHVLDWHHRAQEFGLAVTDHDEQDAAPFAGEPKRLLEHDEPEAFAPQHVEEGHEFDEPDEP